jgi:hypothetical protein
MRRSGYPEVVRVCAMAKINTDEKDSANIAEAVL